MDRRICMDKVFGINFRSYWMGISICMVMLLHIVMYRSSDEFLFRTLKMLFLQGDAGVNVFFFLSAYGLCHSLENNSINKFYRNRISRIYPMYLVYIVGLYVYRGCPVDYKSLFLDLSGLKVFCWDERPGDAWYMSAIIITYLLFPLLFRLMSKSIMRKWQMVLLVVVMITFLYYIPGIHSFFLAMFHARLYIVLLGIASYFMIEDKQKTALIKLYSSVAALSLFFYNDCSFYFYIPLVLWCCDRLINKHPCFHFFSFIGRHSLEIYLAQVFTLQVLLANTMGNYYLDVMLCLLLTIPLAWILYVAHKYSWKLINFRCK